jgi:hypothetical protein
VCILIKILFYFMLFAKSRMIFSCTTFKACTFNLHAEVIDVYWDAYIGVSFQYIHIGDILFWLTKYNYLIAWQLDVLQDTEKTRKFKCYACSMNWSISPNYILFTAVHIFHSHERNNFIDARFFFNRRSI